MHATATVLSLYMPPCDVREWSLQSGRVLPRSIHLQNDVHPAVEIIATLAQANWVARFIDACIAGHAGKTREIVAAVEIATAVRSPGGTTSGDASH